MLQIITIICVTHVQKNCQIRASIKQLLTKYKIFTILPQISHFHKNRNFTSIIICNFLDQLLHPYTFHGRDMSGILFFIFTSWEPLIILEVLIHTQSHWILSSCLFVSLTDCSLTDRSMDQAGP